MKKGKRSGPQIEGFSTNGGQEPRIVAQEEVQGTSSSKEETSEAITTNLNVNQPRWVSLRDVQERVKHRVCS